MPPPPPTPTLFPYTTLFRSPLTRIHTQHRAPSTRHCAPTQHIIATMTDVRIHVHEMDCADEAALVRRALAPNKAVLRSEEHTSELQSLAYLVCRLLLEKKNP